MGQIVARTEKEQGTKKIITDARIGSKICQRENNCDRMHDLNVSGPQGQHTVEFNQKTVKSNDQFIILFACLFVCLLVRRDV